MRRILDEEVILSALLLLLAGVWPNIFPAAQAGLAKMPALALFLLIPAIVLLGLLFAVACGRGHRRLANHMLIGFVAGLIATIGLEVVRATSFRLGGMPGDLPRPRWPYRSGAAPSAPRRLAAGATLEVDVSSAVDGSQ